MTYVKFTQGADLNWRCWTMGTENLIGDVIKFSDQRAGFMPVGKGQCIGARSLQEIAAFMHRLELEWGNELP